MQKRYKEAAHLIQATDELLDYFQDYVKTTQEIKQIKSERDRLCKELRLQVLEDFSLQKKEGPQEQLRQACMVMEAIGEQATNDLRSWYTQFLLEPYQELFGPGKVESTFENTKRRFAWFKRLLKENAANDIFPESWQMQELLCLDFCRVTRLHLDALLSQSYQEIDVSLIIEAIQFSKEFENELHRKFSNKTVSQNKTIKPQVFKFEGCVSQTFEPYLKSYSDQEQRKIQSEIEQKCQDDQLEQIDTTVYSSSLYLFKNIKASFKRCTSFSKAKALFDLTTAFKNVLRFYCQLLRRKLPIRAFEQPTLLSEEQELVCVYVINTCEYCLEMIPKLHQQIQDTISEDYSLDLQQHSSIQFQEAINSVAKCLVQSLEVRCDTIYSQQMLNQNWLKFENVVESAYMKSVTQLLVKRLSDVKLKINNAYYVFLLNKLVPSMANQFLAAIYKLKRVNDQCAHQFQLDLEELKNCLISSVESPQPLSYVQNVAKSFQKVEVRIKVLGYPDDVMREAYSSMVGGDNKDDLNILLALRGLIKPQNEFQRQMVNFINQL